MRTYQPGGREAVDILTIVIAAAGLILGVFNWLKSIRDERVVLKVKPLSIYELGDGQCATNETRIPEGKELSTIGLKVINLSKFEVSLVETGFQFVEGTDKERLCFPLASVLGTGNPLPIRIPSREAVIIAFPPEKLPSSVLKEKIDSVYIHTACELEFFGSGGVINDFKPA